MPSATVTAIFNCSRERAFQAPILGDATRFLTGHLLQPAVVGFEDDETWGQVGGVRYPVTAGNLLVPRRRIFKDEILERRENEYWQWTIYNFQIPALFFATKAVGEWTVQSHPGGGMAVSYTYTFTSRHVLLRPITWLFVNLQWKGMMRRAIKGIQQQAESGEAFVYK